MKYAEIKNSVPSAFNKIRETLFDRKMISSSRILFCKRSFFEREFCKMDNFVFCQTGNHNLDQTARTGYMWSGSVKS